MDTWLIAGIIIAALVAALVWLSFLEKPTSGFSRILRFVTVATVASVSFWLIAFGFPGRDVRGVAWSLLFGVGVWRLGAPLRDLRPIQWALALVAAFGVFFFWFKGGPDDVLAGVRLAVAVLVSVEISVVRRLPRAFRGPKRDNLTKEDRSPLEFTSDDGARLVDVIDLLFGSTRPDGGCGEAWKQRQGQRANNAHGSFARGVLCVDPGFRRTEPPPLFRAGQVTVLARFSNVKGHRRDGQSPRVDRDDSAKDVHGLSLRFDGNDVSALDIVALDIDRFIVRTRTDFIVFMRITAAGSLKSILGAIRMVAFGRTTLGAVRAALGKQIDSYANRTFYGIHTFWWRIGATTVPVRYVLTPELDAEWHQPPGDRRSRLDGDLSHNLGLKRLARFRFDLLDGSALNQRQLLDPVLPWPRRTPLVHVGELVLNQYVQHDDDHDALGFNPHHLTPGITPSDDEILMARRAAYPESHVRRLGNRADTRPGPSA